jgi:phage shock protein C
MAERPKRLYRSRTDRQLTGVLGGVSEYLGLDPSLVRIVYVIVTILTGFVPGIFLYFMMAFIVPVEPEGSDQPD